jgi:hypothetical protein
LQGALDTLSTLIGAGGPGADATSELAMSAAIKAWDAGEAVLDLAETAANAERIDRLLETVGAAVGALSAALGIASPGTTC